MKTKIKLLGLIAGSLIAFPFSIAAKPDSAMMEKHHEKMMADLKLSADQKAKLKDQRSKHMESMKPFREKMKGIRERIKAELLKPQPSKQALDGFAVELGDLHKQMAQMRNDHLLQLKSILTPEQFSKLVNRDWRDGPGMRGGPHRWMGKDKRGGPGHGTGEGPDEM
jgi:Spy/CpxP family protein refolding chaperone